MNDTGGPGGGRKLAVFGITKYTSKEGEQKTRWTRIGVAFRNHDGSINAVLTAFPIGSDKIQIREDWEEDRAAGPRRLETVEVRP